VGWGLSWREYVWVIIFAWVTMNIVQDLSVYLLTTLCNYLYITEETFILSSRSCRYGDVMTKQT